MIRGATLIDGNGDRQSSTPSSWSRAKSRRGMVDVHAHALVPTCGKTPEGLRFAGFAEALSERLLGALLRFGVTTARSPATLTERVVELRDHVAAGAVLGPRLRVPGELINGRDTTAEAMRAEIWAQAKAGVDFGKLFSQLTP